MPLHAIPPFSELDREQFAALLRQESVTPEGQNEKIKIVRSQVEERIARGRLSMKKILMVRGYGEREAEEEARKQFNDLRFIQIPVPEMGQDMQQLLIVRGAQAMDKEGRKECLNVLVPAHIDTVPLIIKEQLEMNYDPADMDMVIARGAYDMHAGVHAGIVLAPELKLPPGVNAFFAFTFDEELRSKGANAMIEWMQKHGIWDDIDIVLSGEIGHVDVPKGDDRMRYFMGRRGRLKYRTVISVHEASTGHFADKHVRNATHAMLEAGSYLIDRYNGKDGREPLLKRHPKFEDPETLQFGNSSAIAEQSGSSSASPKKLPPSEGPTSAELYFNILSVPGRTRESSLKEIRMVFDEIKAVAGAEKHRIDYMIDENPHETSYEGYEMPEDHMLGTITANVLKHVSSGAVPDYAPSVADETLYAAALDTFGMEHFRGVITIPPVGNNAHRIDERVSLTSIVRMREAMRLLLESAEGFAQLSKYKRETLDAIK